MTSDMSPGMSVRKLAAALDRWGRREEAAGGANGPTTWHFRKDALTVTRTPAGFTLADGEGRPVANATANATASLVAFLHRATGVDGAIPLLLTETLRPRRLSLRFGLCGDLDLFDSVFVRFRLGARVHTIWTQDVGDCEKAADYVAGRDDGAGLLGWLEAEFGEHPQFGLFLRKNRRR